MKNIVLICVAGMSTSLLVSRMKEAAKAENYACAIAAHPIADASKAVPEADVVLLGPQVKYMLSKLRTEYPDQTIEAIDMRIYGMIDGKGALTQARKFMGEL